MTADLPELSLRAAEAADAPTLARLRVAGLIEQGLMTPEQAPAFLPVALTEIQRLFSEGHIAAWLALEGGTAIGCASVIFWNRLPYPGSSLHAEIAGVYVAPDCRRQGLATEITRKAVATAQARGVRKIILHPSAQAVRLYRRLGFVDGNQLMLAAEGLAALD
jgi:ribosomal protein S18 acetylase RimI-like enzyme